MTGLIRKYCRHLALYFRSLRVFSDRSLHLRDSEYLSIQSTEILPIKPHSSRSSDNPIGRVAGWRVD
jgi:hypothetical protein